jgi:hypothetical protein
MHDGNLCRPSQIHRAQEQVTYVCHLGINLSCISLFFGSVVTSSFGGTDGLQWFNDTWFFDARSNSWVQIECTGHIPSPREGHAAALVGDIVYIFGGRGSDGKILSDLYAFKVPGNFTFPNEL